MIFLCGWICFWQIKDGQAELQKHIAGEVLRFHVKGHSDSKEDQWIKMQVKERILTYLEPWMKNLAQVDEAKLFVENHFPNMKKEVQETLNLYGCSYGFSLELEERYFPEKTYGDCTFPKGVYESFVITLGEGGGRNWWCMVYPGLCFWEDSYGIVTKESKKKLENSLSKDAYTWITGEWNQEEGENVEIRFTFKCCQWLDKLKDLNFLYRKGRMNKGNADSYMGE